MPTHRLALTWGDVLAILLLALLGIGGAHLAGTLVDARARDGRPTLDTHRDRHGLARREEDVALVRATREAAWRALEDERLALARRGSTGVTAGTGALRATTDTGERVLRALERETARADSIANASMAELALARAASGREFAADSSEWASRVRWGRAVWATAAGVAVVLAGVLALTLHARAGDPPVHPARVAIGALGILALVFGYQALVAS